jgi:hypothetical protein
MYGALFTLLTRESADDSAFDLAAGFAPDSELPAEDGLDRLLLGNCESTGFEGARAFEAARRCGLAALADCVGGVGRGAKTGEGDRSLPTLGAGALEGARPFDCDRAADLPRLTLGVSSPGSLLHFCFFCLQLRQLSLGPGKHWILCLRQLRHGSNYKEVMLVNKST